MKIYHHVTIHVILDKEKKGGSRAQVGANPLEEGVARSRMRRVSAHL